MAKYLKEFAISKCCLHLITTLLILLAVSGMKLIIPGEGMSWKTERKICCLWYIKF